MTRSGTVAGPAGADPQGGSEVARLRSLVTMCSHLTAASYAHVEPAHILGRLASDVGVSVVLVDRGRQVRAAAGRADPARILAAAGPRLDASAVEHRPGGARHGQRAACPVPAGPFPQVAVAPVVVGGEVAGFLVAAGGGDDDLSAELTMLACEHGAMVCGVLLSRAAVVAAAADRARRDTVRRLLQARGGDEAELARCATRLGIDPSGAHSVAVFEPGELQGSRRVDVAGVLCGLAPDAIVAAYPDEVVAIVPASASGADSTLRAHDLAERCLDDLGADRATVGAVGIGNGHRGAAGIATSYTQACRARLAAARTGAPAEVALFAELGIRRLLLCVPDREELRAFGADVVGPLIEVQQATGVAYLATLSAYLAANRSPRRAARLLEVHPNTVSHRIRRIEEIVGLRLARHRDRLLVEVAVEIVDRLGTGPVAARPPTRRG